MSNLTEKFRQFARKRFPPVLKQYIHFIEKEVYKFLALFGYRYNLKVYDNDFFVLNQGEGVRMVQWFVPLMTNIFNPNSVIDIGCGTGHYLKHFLSNGLTDIYGIEGADEALKSLMIDKKYILKYDLRKPLKLNRKWDLCLSIEVAEHIDKLYSDNYLKIMTDSSNTIVMTAAHLNQGGTAHVNEQPQEWWIDKFKKLDYEFNKEKTNSIRKGISEAQKNGFFVSTWFYPNIMVFSKIKK